MEHITVKAGQSLLDIAVEHCGSMEAVVGLAFANSVSLTDQFAPSGLLEAVEVIAPRVAALFSYLSNKPATAITRAEERNLCDEVGFNTADFGTFTYEFDDLFYKGN